MLNPKLSGLLGGYRRRGLFPGGEGEVGDLARSPAGGVLSVEGGEKGTGGTRFF